MAEPQELADIIKNLQDDVRTIVKGEIELVKAELVPQAKSAGLGLGLFGTAAYVAVLGLTLLFIGLSFLLSLGFEAWFSLPMLGAAAWGFSIMAVLLFVLAGVAVLIGKQRMVFTKPEAALEQAEESVATVRRAITQTQEEIKTLSWSGRPRQPELE